MHTFSETMLNLIYRGALKSASRARVPRIIPQHGAESRGIELRRAVGQGHLVTYGDNNSLRASVVHLAHPLLPWCVCSL